MILPASSHFIALCQSQIYLLSRSLGATSAVIYLAERTAGRPNPTLIPVVAYPEQPEAWGAVDWQQATGTRLLPGAQLADPTTDAQSALSRPDAIASGAIPSTWLEEGGALGSGPVSASSVRSGQEAVASAQAPSLTSELASEHQMVLPLAHEGIVLGVLVSAREGLPWQLEERQQAERIADTLTLARVMDQRGQWLEQRLHHKQLTQSYQSETFHDLIHQFRNPLTAMRTFGKLLLKRMQSGDANRSIAEGIVRESERLQDLIQHFDEAVAVGDADLQTDERSPESEVLALPAAVPAPLSLPKLLTSTQAETPLDQIYSGERSGALGAGLRLELLQWIDVLKPLLISADAVAQEKQITVSVAIPADLPAVWADRGALREVMSNLLDNALKYSPWGALVWVQAGLFREQGPQTLQGVAVGDTGPGIPASDQARIFERHYRGVQTQGNIPGTGLGLAIAHDLIHDMGGQINLLSPASISGLAPDPKPGTPAGPGTMFIVWLPQSSA